MFLTVASRDPIDPNHAVKRHLNEPVHRLEVSLFTQVIDWPPWNIFKSVLDSENGIQCSKRSVVARKICPKHLNLCWLSACSKHWTLGPGTLSQTLNYKLYGHRFIITITPIKDQHSCGDIRPIISIDSLSEKAVCVSRWTKLDSRRIEQCWPWKTNVGYWIMTNERTFASARLCFFSVELPPICSMYFGPN